MNKQDWTYKTFGEVGSFLRGKSIQKADFIENGFPCIHYGQIHTKFGVSVDKHLSEIPLELYNKSIIASHGDVIIAITSEDLEGSCKSTAWLGNYDIAVSSHAAVYKHNLNPKFIAYYLRSKSFYYEKQKYARGFKVMEIKPSDIEKIPIPVPPIEEQERIVAELDLLQGIIEKKKEQLKAYDQLAQSIFYTMFGDPIDNPKGWETKTMSDVCASMTKGPFGSDIKKSLFVPKSKDTYKVYIQANAIEKDISLGDYYISKDYFENKMFRFEVKPNDYIITCDGTLGKYIRLPKCIERGIISASLLRLTLNDNINYRYFEHLWDYYILHQQIKDIRNTALKHLPSASKMGKTTIPLPPISLQEEFAEKVEAIERQKALVQQSIVETQTMFDYTMDKYFG